MLRWLKTVVVSDEEKASLETSGGGREGERKRIAVEVSKLVLDGIRTGTGTRFQDKSGGYPDCWPGGARHVGDASPICCSHMERGKAGLDTAAGDRGDRECAKRERTARRRVPSRGWHSDRPIVVLRSL